MRMKKICFLLLMVVGAKGFSQLPVDIPVGYFSAPVDIPMLLSGSFGEMRTNHFHTGIDIKTQGKIGLPIHAIDSGWVSRVRISLSGYGRAIYIDHPNGYTSVYAHLDSFNKEIGSFVEEAQYDLEQDVIDLYPARGKLPVSRHEIIGLSGNTGRSGGPHLHFEIRETKTEYPLNPLLFGFKIKDRVPPKAYAVMAIPLDQNALVLDSKIREVSSKNLGVPFRVQGRVGFAIKTYDFFDGSRNSCGTYRVKLYRNDQLVYAHVLDQLDFYTNRFVNAHVVYDYFKQHNTRFQRSYKLPYDLLPFYDEVHDKNYFSHAPDSLYHYRYELEDYAGNTTEVKFDVKGIDVEAPSDFQVPNFKYDEPNDYHVAGCSVYIPVGRLYDDIFFQCEQRAKKLPEAITPIFRVGTPDIPLQDKIIIKLEVALQDSLLREKAVVVRYEQDEDKITAIGGDFRTGWMEVKTKDFGDYAVMIDTIPPKITPANFQKDMRKKNTMSFKISDNLSGIESYKILIDNDWVLATYIPRSSKLVYRFDANRLAHGKHTVLVIVADERGNESVYSSDFNW